MKRFTKGGISVLLVLAMCISLLSCVSFTGNAVTVDYVYGSYDEFTDVIYNWGTRGIIATFLSPNAEEYYEAKGTSYEELADLAGSTDDDATDSPLYAELKELMTEGMVNTSYGDARYLFPFTECQNSDTSFISGFYDGLEYTNVWNGNIHSREHIWPKSKLTNTSPSASTKADSSDLMMLRHAISNLNSSRGNKAYGEGSSYFDPNTHLGSTGYDVRGDVARTVLYGYVFWDNTENMWGTDGVIESVEILLSWMIADPVDTWEMGRNDSVESINGCRNVFVDYPELAFELFEEEIPENMATPSTGASCNVTAVSSNNAWGSVKVAGTVINAYPATGYELAGYRVTKGTADVTVQGNLLVVNATGDCEITVDFKARANSAVIFMANGKTVSAMTAHTGDAITLPDGDLAVLDGYEFAGWVESEINEEITTAPVFYPAGAEYVVNADTSLYALFARLGEGTGEGAATNYTLLTGALVSGDYIIVHENMAMNNSVKSNKLQATAVTPSNGVINNPDKSIIWTVTVTGTTATICNVDNGKYLQTAKSGTNLTMNTTEAVWNIIENGDGTYDFQNPNATTRYIRYNAQYAYFGSYVATSNGAPLKLYKATAGVSYYTTGAEVQDTVAEYWKDDMLVGAYADLESAMAAAGGGTVVLVADAEADNIIVKPGVALDLNGYNLTANMVVAMNGATVCDSGCGLLQIAKGNLILAKENGNAIPVWNGADGYMFTDVTIRQMTAGAAAGNARYIFLPSFSNAEAAALLADGGLDNDLTIKVRLTWAGGYSQQFYTYSDDLVMQVYDGTGSLAFDLTVTGITGIADMVASPIVTTASGAEATVLGLNLAAN